MARVGTLIVLFTDFGLHGPYTGQVKAVLQRAPISNCGSRYARKLRVTTASPYA